MFATRIRTAAVAAAIAVSMAAPLASASPTAQINSGYTLVELAPSFVGALTSLGVAPSKVLPGTLHQRIALFPITGGRLDASNAKGEVPHSGKPDELLAKYGIDAAAIVKRVKALV